MLFFMITLYTIKQSSNAHDLNDYKLVNTLKLYNDILAKNICVNVV